MSVDPLAQPPPPLGDLDAIVVVDTSVDSPSTGVRMQAYWLAVPIAGAAPTAADLDAAVTAWMATVPPPVPSNSSVVYAAWASDTGVAGLSYMVTYVSTVSVARQ
jgi:hypothetical protein